jgi:hypothetical protein
MDDYREGDIVVIKAGEDWPQHLFKIHEVYDDCVTGHSLDGPLEGCYGEPPLDLILGLHKA